MDKQVYLAGKGLIKEATLRDSMKFLAVIIILVFISKISTAYPQEELETESVTELKEIQFQIVEADKMEFTIEVEGEFHYEIFGLGGPPRLVVDLFPIQKISVGPYVDIGIIGVMRIRVGFFQPQVARVVFDLGDRIPNYRVTSIEGGIKVTFWFEEVIKREVVKPPEVEEVEAVPEKIPEVVTEEIVPRKPRRILDHNYFVQAKSGIGLPIKPSFEANTIFTLYGEQGSMDENYKIQLNYFFDLNIGRYIWIKDTLVKGNLSFSYQMFNNKGSFQTTLPHPLIPDNPRNYAFGGTLKGSLFNISGSPLFSVLEKGKFEIWLGPIIGFSIGKLDILEDITLEETSPFEETDITVTAQTYVGENIASLLLGGVGNFEYKIARNFSLILDTKFIYLSPKSKTLDAKINLSQLQLAIGFLYYFY